VVSVLYLVWAPYAVRNISIEPSSFAHSDMNWRSVSPSACTLTMSVKKAQSRNETLRMLKQTLSNRRKHMRRKPILCNLDHKTISAVQKHHRHPVDRRFKPCLAQSLVCWS